MTDWPLDQVFDFNGHQVRGDDVSLGVQNQLLAQLLEHWRLDCPDVVAHDFGGATALRAHLLNGKDYRSLTTTLGSHTAERTFH